jgi:hypothetical protein
MTSQIQNYGFTKTFVRNNNDILENEIKWKGDYDGKIAVIDVDINNNGNRELVSIQLTNNDIRQLFGIQPIDIPLEQRLTNDFLKPITLEGALIQPKSRKHKRKHYKRRKTKRTHHYYNK